MDNDLEAAVGVLGLLALLVAARFAPDPEIGFVLQIMGLGGALGLGVAYILHHDDPDADRWRTVTFFTLAGIGVGLLLVAVDHLS